MKLLVAVSSSVCVIVATNSMDRAVKYADRIIDLSGGMVISDRESQPSESNGDFKITLPLTGEPFRDKSRYNKKCTRNAYFKVIRGKIHDRWETFVLVCVAMTFLISALVTVASLSLYDYSNAVTATFIDNDLYFIPLQKNTSSSSVLDRDETHEWILTRYPDTKLADMYVATGSLANTGIEGSTSETNFIVVEDYSVLELPLIRGSYPDKPDKILVSRATANSIFNSGYFSDIQIIEGIIGRKVQLSGSGLCFTISGIYESDEPGNEHYEGEQGSASDEMKDYYDFLHAAVYAAPGITEYAKESESELTYNGTGLLLCGDFREKSKALSVFLPGNEKGADDESYFVDSPVEKAVSDMDGFLTALAKACRYFRVIICIALLMAMVIYMLVSGRKNMKNLGVLRMIGKPPFLLILENGFFAVFVEALCLGLANLVGCLFLAKINSYFSFDSGSVLSLYYLNGISSLTIMATMICASGLSSLVLYYVIRTWSPYKLIISNK